MVLVDSARAFRGLGVEKHCLVKHSWLMWSRDKYNT